jgi:anti-sigma regulatory factor (Ser/Thr protein kinase)
MSPVPPDPSAVLRREYGPDLRTLHSARREVVDWLADLGADEGTQQRAALIVSELCSNAIQNSPGLPYNLEIARVDDDHAEISVRNRPADHLPPAREQWRPGGDLSLKELSLRGRGLAIVDSLSEEVTIEHLGDELVVTARLHLDVAQR